LTDENPYRSPDGITQSASTKRRWWQVDVPSYALAILFFFGILQYWGIGLLMIYRVVGHFSQLVDFGTYYVHWSSVGGLIGFAVSRGGWRGSVIGAVIGLGASVALML
jgi:hypothetical protein